MNDQIEVVDEWANEPRSATPAERLRQIVIAHESESGCERTMCEQGVVVGWTSWTGCEMDLHVTWLWWRGCQGCKDGRGYDGRDEMAR